MPCIPIGNVGHVNVEPAWHYPHCEPGDCYCQAEYFDELDRRTPRPPVDDCDPIGDDPNPEREPF